VRGYKPESWDDEVKVCCLGNEDGVEKSWRGLGNGKRQMANGKWANRGICENGALNLANEGLLVAAFGCE
jgi:hypothetical protein